MASYMSQTHVPNYTSQTGATFNEENYVLVAAIDFGTTFSGYAFSFRNSPDSIKMNKNWSENMGFQSYKAPTCVLTGPDHEFLSFGFEAENTYTEIIADEELSQSHHLYRHFKMMLYDERKITRETMIKSTAGHSRKAMDIFVMSLKYLKDHLINTINMGYQYTGSDASMIKWVITVPAIWNDEAKQFMREAAFKAGLISSQDSRQLVIALEPEAASVYCRSLDVDHFVQGEDDNKSAKFDVGTVYMVIDAGGGTIDVTVHKVLPNDQVKELHAATGGTWGGTKVDERFVALLKQIMGERFIDTYQRENPYQWLALRTTFEKVKKCAKTEESSKLVLPLSWAIGNKYQEVMGSGIEKAIKEASSLGVSFANGSFVLNYKAIKNLFLPVVSEVAKHIDKLLQNPNVSICEYILLVGGFAEAPFLQDEIEKRFGNQRCLLVPNEAQMSVIKGAVLYGHRPAAIKSRIAKKTYGTAIARPFDETVHDANKVIIVDGKSYCRKLFDQFAQKGEEIEVGTEKHFIYNPISCDQTKADIKLFSTHRVIPTYDVTYVDANDMERVGKFVVSMPNISEGQRRKIRLDIEFGGTEIYVCGTDESTGNKADANVDFLTE